MADRAKPAAGCGPNYIYKKHRQSGEHPRKEPLINSLSIYVHIPALALALAVLTCVVVSPSWPAQVMWDLSDGVVTNVGDGTAEDVVIVEPVYRRIGDVAAGQSFEALPTRFKVRWLGLKDAWTGEKVYRYEEITPDAGQLSAWRSTPGVVKNIRASYNPPMLTVWIESATDDRPVVEVLTQVPEAVQQTKFGEQPGRTDGSFRPRMYYIRGLNRKIADRTTESGREYQTFFEIIPDFEQKHNRRVESGVEQIDVPLMITVGRGMEREYHYQTFGLYRDRDGVKLSPSAPGYMLTASELRTLVRPNVSSDTEPASGNFTSPRAWILGAAALLIVLSVSAGVYIKTRSQSVHEDDPAADADEPEDPEPDPPPEPVASESPADPPDEPAPEPLAPPDPPKPAPTDMLMAAPVERPAMPVKDGPHLPGEEPIGRRMSPEKEAELRARILKDARTIKEIIARKGHRHFTERAKRQGGWGEQQSKEYCEKLLNYCDFFLQLPDDRWLEPCPLSDRKVMNQDAGRAILMALGRYRNYRPKRKPKKEPGGKRGGKS